MRTAAWETAPQIALRNNSKEVRGKGQHICDFGKGGVHEIKHKFFVEDFAGHGHHQMINTEIRLIIFSTAKDGEAL